MMSVKTKIPQWQEEIQNMATHEKNAKDAFVECTLITKCSGRPQIGGISILLINSNSRRRKIKPAYKKVKFIDSFDVDCPWRR